MLRRLLTCMIVLGFTAGVFGQDLWDIARTTINGKNVAIEYGRPLLKGRKLADLMKQLPPDRIWRAGSGAVTILSTETDLDIAGKRVPAGSYSLYMYCPEKGDYALIVNREIGQPADTPLPKSASDRSNRPYPHFMDYSTIANQEVARIPLNQIPAAKSEILIYGFEPEGNGVVLTIRWGDQAWKVEIKPAS